MVCGTGVLWRPIPPGSRIRFEASGDEDAFNVAIGVSLNGAQQPMIRHEELVPGPASRTIEQGNRWVFTPVLTVFHDVEEPVTLRTVIVDASDNPVQIEVPDSPTVQAECEWSVSTPSTLAIQIFVTEQ